MTRPRRPSIVLFSAALLAACGAEAPVGRLRVSGHVEATDVQVSAEVGGRVAELKVDEGDRVSAGDTIARIDSRDIELQIRRARADRAAADAQLRLLLAGSRPEDIQQARAQADAAAAEVTALEAELHAAELDLQRFESLLQANAGSQKQRDDARARAEAVRERHRAALDRARAAQQAVARLEAGARREEIDAARARVAAADAQIAVLEKSLSDTRVLAPVAGVVTHKLANAGEIVAPRTPLVVVTDLDHAWANVFVPEPMIPRIRFGQPAAVYTDAGGAPIAGTVAFVSPRAEFTPRNVQTPEERSKLVYRIKISVDNREGVLKPGMPVDAEFALE